MLLEACQGAPQRSPRGGSLSLRQRAPEKPSSQVPELQWLGREEFPGYLIETNPGIAARGAPSTLASTCIDGRIDETRRGRGFLPIHSHSLSVPPSILLPFPSHSLRISRRFHLPETPPSCLPVPPFQPPPFPPFPSGSPSLPGSSRSAGSIPLFLSPPLSGGPMGYRSPLRSPYTRRATVVPAPLPFSCHANSRFNPRRLAQPCRPNQTRPRFRRHQT